MDCTKCFTDYISCGVNSIAVQGVLLPETDYTWVLTTPHCAKYHGNVRTDNDGFFIIDTAVLPAGLLNPYAGVFVLQVQTDNCNQSLWNNSVYCEPYSCINFTVVNGDLGKNTLGCPCPGDFIGYLLMENNGFILLENNELIKLD